MKNYIIALLLLGGYCARAQAGWTLEDCISYALNHNISLQQAEITNAVNKNNSDQAKASSLPSINAGAAHIYNFGKTIDRFTNTFADQMVLSQNFYLNGQVVLWNGLSQYNTIKASHYTYLSGVEALNQQKNDLSLSVANAYIGVIFQEEQVKIIEQQYTLTQEQLDRTIKLVEAGSQARSTEYELRSQLASEQANLTSAENAYQIAILNLQQLMNLDSVQVFKLQRPDISLPAMESLSNSVSRLYEISLKTQPGIKSSEYQILAAEKRLAASRGRWSPSLSLSATLGTGTSGLAKDVTGVRITGADTIGITSAGQLVYAPAYEILTKPTPFTEQFRNNVNKSIGFQLNIPIFNGLQTHTAVRNAQLNALNAKLSQDLSKQSLYKNIMQAHTNAKAALNTYNAQKSSVEAAQISYDYAKQKFETGAISAYDYNLSKNKLFAAESALLRAKYDFVLKLKVLEYYEGKPLGF